MKLKSIILLTSILNCTKPNPYYYEEKEYKDSTLTYSCEAKPRCNFGHKFDLKNDIEKLKGAKIIISNEPTIEEARASEYLKIKLKAGGIYHAYQEPNPWDENLILIGTYDNNPLIKEVMEYSPNCREKNPVIYGVTWKTNNFSTLILVGQNTKSLEIMAKEFKISPALNGKSSVILDEILCN